jgi:hypothetical protein
MDEYLLVVEVLGLEPLDQTMGSAVMDSTLADLSKTRLLSDNQAIKSDPNLCTSSTGDVCSLSRLTTWTVYPNISFAHFDQCAV